MDDCDGIAWAGLFVSLVTMMHLYFRTLGFVLVFRFCFGKFKSCFSNFVVRYLVLTRDSGVNPGGSTRNVILHTCWSNSGGAKSVYDVGPSDSQIARSCSSFHRLTTSRSNLLLNREMSMN